MCESKMISKNNDEVDVGCGNAYGGSRFLFSYFLNTAAIRVDVISTSNRPYFAV